MRVLQLVKTSVGATWALQQMRELVALGVDVHAAVPGDGPMPQRYEAAGVRVHRFQADFPVRRPHHWPALRRGLRALVSDVRPDLIHSHFVGTTLSARLALGRRHPIPRVFQVPGPLHLEHALYRRVEMGTAGPADYWIGSCRWTQERYRSLGVPADRVFLSYYGIDVEQFTRGEPGKLRGELGIKPETGVVGMVAYMYPPKRHLGQARGLKGHEDLIEAVAICLERGLDLAAVFVGGAWNRAVHYENRLRRLGREKLGPIGHFLGTRNDVEQLYPDFNVAVHPSLSENVGGARESLLLAVPTIATNVGGFPDVVRQGETGWLVPPRAPLALADAIEEALSQPERALTMAAAGEALVRSMFDVRRTAAEVYRCYDKVLDLGASGNTEKDCGYDPPRRSRQNV